MGPLPPNIDGHIALFGSRLLHGQEDLWKTNGRFECEFGYLENAHECHSSSSSSSRKRLEFINIPLPGSMSSQTLCSVWEKWETILLNPGRIKSNGFRTTILQRIESN